MSPRIREIENQRQKCENSKLFKLRPLVVNIEVFITVHSFITCYCCTPITMKFIYLSRVLRPLNIKGRTQHDRSHVALIAQLVEHCTGNAKVVGSNPVQSLNFFQVIFPVVSWLHSHLSFFHYLLLLDTYYHEIHILELSITSTEHKGPNPNPTALMWL